MKFCKMILLCVVVLALNVVLSGCTESSKEAGESLSPHKNDSEQNQEQESKDSVQDDLKDSDLDKDDHNVQNDNNISDLDKLGSVTKHQKAQQQQQKTSESLSSSDADVDPVSEKNNRDMKTVEHSEKKEVNSPKQDVQKSKDDNIVDLAQNTSQLSCKDLATHFGVLFEFHIDYGGYPDNYSTKYTEVILSKFIKYLDPQKIYFLKSDVDNIMQNHVDTLHVDIHQRKCDSIVGIQRLWVMRVGERQEEIRQQLAANHDYTLDEYLVMKDRPYVEADAISERVRKVVKYNTLLKALDDEKLLSSEKTSESVKSAYHQVFVDSQNRTEHDSYFDFLKVAYLSTDIYTNFLDEEDSNQMQDGLSAEIYGKIGTALSVVDEGLSIRLILYNSPTYKHGFLKVGDIIAGVRENVDEPWKTLQNHSAHQLISMIRGKQGTKVHLFIKRPVHSSEDGDQEDSKNDNDDVERYYTEHEVSLTRDNFTSFDRLVSYHALQEKSALMDGRDISVGYIHVPAFKQTLHPIYGRSYIVGTAKHVQNAVEDLVENYKIQSLVLDLRGNTGGFLTEAQHMVQQLVNPHIGLFTKRRYGVNNGRAINDVKDFETQISISPSVLEDYKGPVHLDIPLVVLVNHSSASASEILAQALQVGGRALIVGDPSTYGKGSIQSFRSYGNGFAAKITVGRFYGLNGLSINHDGVKSDIVIPSRLAVNARVSNLDDSKIDKKPHPLPSHLLQKVDHGYRDLAMIDFLRKQSKERGDAPGILNKAWTWYNAVLAEKQTKQLPKSTLSFEKFQENIDQTDDESPFLKMLDKDSKSIVSLLDTMKYDPSANVGDLITELRGYDYVMREALNIAADYYLVCRGGSEIMELSVEDAQRMLEEAKNMTGCRDFVSGN